MEPLRRVATRRGVPAWWALTGVGVLAFGLATWNFASELSTVGFGVGPVLAAALAMSLSAGIVYVSLSLRRTTLDQRDQWTVVASALGGGLAFTVGQAVTLAIKLVEGRPVSEPLLPVLVVGSLGTLGGVVLGQNYVTARRERVAAERSRDAVAFTNSLLRHDVRNALQIIVAHVDDLVGHDDEAVATSAGSMRSQTDAIRRLLSEVESLSAVLTGDFEPEPLDLVAVLGSVADGTADSFDHATVETALPDSLPVEGADGLYSVFDNLVKNAVQHADADGVHVRVEAHSTGDRGVARIADDGPGIPESERGRVFERGVTSDGGGHGLYVARTIVEALDGQIDVADSDLGGAAFVVELPLADDHDEEDPFTA